MIQNKFRNVQGKDITTATVNTFITSRSSPPWLTKTLPRHVMTKSTINAITFPLTLFTIVTSFTRLHARTSLVPWGANTLPTGLVARSVAMVTHWTGRSTAGTGLITKQSLPASITSTVSKYWMARSVNTRTRLRTVHTPWARRARDCAAWSSKTWFTPTGAIERVTAERWRGGTTAFVNTVFTKAVWWTSIFTVKTHEPRCTKAIASSLLRKISCAVMIQYKGNNNEFKIVERLLIRSYKLNVVLTISVRGMTYQLP